MATPILATKLYIPPLRSKVVLRPRLIEALNEGLSSKLTLISAPAGFGKSTLVSEWVSNSDRPIVWLSLDEGDNDPARFLAYFVATLKAVAPNLDEDMLRVLQAPQPPPIESILTLILNEIASISVHFVLVLDDYHVIDSQPLDNAVTFLLNHMPPQMHLMIATREDPRLPLVQLRARGYLTELRARELRFNASEAAQFLNQVMGLSLSIEDIAALETRTEGWIAGLQLAGLALKGTISRQGAIPPPDFIQSFSASHHYVLDYLVEEVVNQQPESVQEFLMQTSILERMCGRLCDAVLLNEEGSGQQTLEYLERANLFIIPLDNERRWYRYHHLFADLLRQRFHHGLAATSEDALSHANTLHIRASQWYEDNGLDLEAFQHAAAANDIERAERLVEGRGIPLHLRGAVTTIIDWLSSLPTEVMNARPSLWWRYGAMLLVVGQTTGVQDKLDAAEAAVAGLPQTDSDPKTRNLLGQIAAARSVLALTRYDVATMLTQSHRALEYLHPANAVTRATAHWTMGYAHLFQRDYAGARQPLNEAIALGNASNDAFTTLLATIGLGIISEGENQLHLAAETYQRILQMAGDQPLQIIYEAYLGMARVLYEWNEIEAAERHAHQSLHLARQYDSVIDRFVVCEVFLARIKLARGDVAGAADSLTETHQAARHKNFVHRLPEVAAVQVITLLKQGNLAAAAHLAETYQLPLSQARVCLAQHDPSAALTILMPLVEQAKAKSWHDEYLKALVLKALAYSMAGEAGKAIQVTEEALMLAEAGGFIRLFIDEGLPMYNLLSEVSVQGMMPAYLSKLLSAFDIEAQNRINGTNLPDAQGLIEPLSQREVEVLQLIAQGLSNQEISERLFLALDTVKGHNRRIFDKLQVQRRTEAVARARELGLL